MDSPPAPNVRVSTAWSRANRAHVSWASTALAIEALSPLIRLPPRYSRPLLLTVSSLMVCTAMLGQHISRGLQKLSAWKMQLADLDRSFKP